MVGVKSKLKLPPPRIPLAEAPAVSTRVQTPEVERSRGTGPVLSADQMGAAGVPGAEVESFVQAQVAGDAPHAGGGLLGFLGSKQEPRAPSKMEHHADGKVTTWESVEVERPLSGQELQKLEHSYYDTIGSPRYPDEGDRDGALKVSVTPMGLVKLVEFGPATTKVLPNGTVERRRPIMGGQLAKQGGEFVLRSEPLPGGKANISLAIEGFEHTVPKWAYKLTQGPIHQVYTRGFLKAKL